MNKKLMSILLIGLFAIMASTALVSNVKADVTYYTVSGRVLLSAGGSPAPNVEVFIQDPSGGPVYGPVSLDPSGYFTLTNVPAGTRTLYIENTLPNYNVLVSYSQIIDVPTVLSVGTIYLNTVTGHVEASSSAVAGANVYIKGNGPIASFNTFPGTPNVEATTDASGNFQLTGLPAGDYTLYVNAPSGAAVQTATISGDTNLGTTTLTNSYTVSGIAHYSGGIPIVMVYMLDSNGREITSTFSDSTGVYALTGIPAGTYTLQFYSITSFGPSGQAVLGYTESITVTDSDLTLPDVSLSLFPAPESPLGALSALSMCFVALIAVTAIKYKPNKK